MLFKLFASLQVLHSFVTFVFDFFVCLFISFMQIWYFQIRFCIFYLFFCCLTNNAECFAPFSATLRRMLQVLCLIFVYFVCVWCGVLRTSLYDPSHNATIPGVSPRSQELWNGAKHSLIASMLRYLHIYTYVYIYIYIYMCIYVCVLCLRKS